VQESNESGFFADHRCLPVTTTSASNATGSKPPSGPVSP
jgi:hypothetical protein